MRLIATFLLLLSISSAVLCQKTVTLTGSIYDKSGALVVGASVNGTDEKGKTFSAKTNNEGVFELPLLSGLYSLEVKGPGFLTIKYPEYLIVETESRKMSQDFVIFGGKYHEPCGYAGSDCLPKEDLIESYTVTYSPKLRGIWKRF